MPGPVVATVSRYLAVKLIGQGRLAATPVPRVAAWLMIAGRMNGLSTMPIVNPAAYGAPYRSTAPLTRRAPQGGCERPCRGESPGQVNDLQLSIGATPPRGATRTRVPFLPSKAVGLSTDDPVPCHASGVRCLRVGGGSETTQPAIPGPIRITDPPRVRGLDIRGSSAALSGVVVVRPPLYTREGQALTCGNA